MIRTKAVAAFWLIYLIGYNANASQELTQAQRNEAESIHMKSSEFMVRKAYEQLAEVLSDERLELLDASQTQWVKYKEANLEVVSSGYAGGSILPLIYAKRAIEMNENRISELSKMYLMEITP